MRKTTIGLLIGGIEDRYFQGFRGVPQSGIKASLNFAEEQGWNRVDLAHSGVYYELRSDGWYKTSDSQCCDTENGLPFEGQKIN